MEHLLCLTPYDFAKFVDVTGMALTWISETAVTLKGSSVFLYEYSPKTDMFCFKGSQL